MRFTKMHGSGNDYIYVNGFEPDNQVDNPAALASLISDRHTGVGGDGLILILPPDPHLGAGVDADLRMRMFNSDGSEGEMCGNGIRCVCKFARDHGLTDARPMRVQTGRGVLTLDYTLDATGKVDQVTVDMGEPILEAGLIPVRIPGLSPDEQVVDHSLSHLVQWPNELAADWIDACGFETQMTCVSMGNPHAVLYCRHAACVELEKVGPTLEEHPMFPNRVNVHIVAVDNEHEVMVRHWERGSGMTRACGTGACAVCVAGVLTGRTARRLTTHVPGGELHLEWREADNHVLMTGPAAEVFSGEWRGAPAAVGVA